MTLRCRVAISAPALAAALVLYPAAGHATVTVYEYHIEHPRYGDIGTYTNTVRQIGDDAEIETELHVAVKVLGIVLFREEARRVERWHGDRFVGFAGVTETNGKKLEVRGEAQGDSFVVTSPAGTIAAPAQVHPSNPWSAMVMNTDVMMSTKSGRVDHVVVSVGSLESVTFDGKDMRLVRYDIVGPKRQFVWVDERGVPVAFRTEEEGTPVDFVLSAPPRTETQDRAIRTVRDASGAATPW